MPVTHPEVYPGMYHSRNPEVYPGMYHSLTPEVYPGVIPPYTLPGVPGWYTSLYTSWYTLVGISLACLPVCTSLSGMPPCVCTVCSTLLRPEARREGITLRKEALSPWVRKRHNEANSAPSLP